MSIDIQQLECLLTRSYLHTDQICIRCRHEDAEEDAYNQHSECKFLRLLVRRNIRAILSGHKPPNSRTFEKDSAVFVAFFVEKISWDFLHQNHKAVRKGLRTGVLVGFCGDFLGSTELALDGK